MRLDTRSKIVGAEEASKAIASWCAAGEDPAVVSGFFDPLLATHAQRLAEAAKGRKLVVAIRDPENPILPARARAELVAALAPVTMVVLEDLPELGRQPVSFERQDEETMRDFVEHVRRRNGG